MAKEPADPRYRPFRIASWAVYFAVLVFFGGSIAVSVIRSVLAMTPARQPSAQATLTEVQCRARAALLWQELDEHRKSLSEQPVVRRADAEYWTAFRVAWLSRHRELETACGVDSPERESLKALLSRLDQAMDLYTTHAVQFAGEVGPTLDALREALDGGAPTPAR